MSEIVNKVVSIEALQAHHRNYRSHPDIQVEQLGMSHARFGQYRSVVLWQRPNNQYMIVAGHGIVEAMKRNGVKQVRADVLPERTPQDEINAILVADNLHAQNASDDETLLAELLKEQQNAGYALETLGTDDETLRQMLESLGDGYLAEDEGEEGAGGDEFDTTPEEGPTRTHVGEMWQLGKYHRLFVGDCTNIENVQRLMNGKQADCCWTDPPYGVSYVGKTKDALTIQNDGKEGIDSFLQRAFVAMDTALEDGAAIYIAHPAGALSVTFGVRFLGQGWRLHETLVWIKDSMVLGHSDYHYRHEPILFGYKSGEGRRGRGAEGWYGDNSQTSVFEIPRPKRSEEHPTMKPIPLIEEMLQNSCPKGGLVYEPFGGSGSTLIAAHRLNMRCNICELDPKYADVILRRFEAETGQTATLLERVEEGVHA